ncbi:hypothetical protein JL720_10314 [Aureococcus anophagefferens]|nr:hypothetical protein JL720_10314 [Aureococcus anophagefferens]
MPEVEAKKCAPGASPPPKKRCARPDDEMHGAAAAVSVADLAGAPGALGAGPLRQRTSTAAAPRRRDSVVPDDGDPDRMRGALGRTFAECRRIAIHVRHGPETGPGLCAAAATAAGGTAVASQLPSELHISGIPVSIVLGACAGNAAPAALKEALKPGVAFATSTVLRSGIVAVGAKLSAAQVLASAGRRRVAVAVANVVAFGSAGMLAYPHAAARLFPADDSSHVGLFLGLAVHDTAQVMGCAASYAEQYSDAAVVGAAAVAKLTRNVFLAGVVPLMALKHGGAASGKSIAAACVVRRPAVGMSASRSLGDYQVASGGKALGLLDADDWKRQADWVGAVLGTKVLLATGLAGVGLSVDFNAKAGVRPFAVGAAGATIVGGVGLSTALLLSHLNRPATAP